MLLRQTVLPKSALGQAVTHTLNMWPILRRCCNYAEVELSNNLADNSMRPVGLGRKNSLRAVRTEGRGDSLGGRILPSAWPARERLPARRVARHGAAQPVASRLAHPRPLGRLPKLTWVAPDGYLRVALMRYELGSSMCALSIFCRLPTSNEKERLPRSDRP